MRPERSRLQDVALLLRVVLCRLNPHACYDFETLKFREGLLDELFVFLLSKVVIVKHGVEVRFNHSERLVERRTMRHVLFAALLILAEREPTPELGTLELPTGDPNLVLNLAPVIAVHKL